MSRQTCQEVLEGYESVASMTALKADRGRVHSPAKRRALANEEQGSLLRIVAPSRKALNVERRFGQPVRCPTDTNEATPRGRCQSAAVCSLARLAAGSGPVARRTH